MQSLNDTVAPIVNINGTSKAELMRQLGEALKAAQTLIDALNEAMPHGRDYPNGPDCGAQEYRKARADMANRIALVREIFAQLLNIALDIDKQG